MPNENDTNKRIPAEVFPAAGFILEEMEERGWSPADLARAMGRDEATIGKLLAGQMTITPVIARELADAFGTSSEFWCNLDAAMFSERTKLQERSHHT